MASALASTPGSTSRWGQAVSKTAQEAVLVQRTWRGVLARRHFSDLFFDTLEASIGQEAMAVPSLAFVYDDYDYDAGPKTPVRRTSLSLEEAQEEAAYNPAASCFMHVPSQQGCASGTKQITHRRSMSGTPGGSCASTPVAPDGPSRWASSAALGASPAIGMGSAVLVSDAAGAAATANARRGSALHFRSPSIAAAPSAACAIGKPAAASHRRVGSGDGQAAASAPAGVDDADADLEFNEQMADSMTLDGLEQLAKMLTGIIAKRNKELVTLQLRRDELTHERDFRRSTVTALVAQVDRSQFVKEERKKEKEERRRRQSAMR